MTQAAVPRDHAGRIDQALRAARLKPIGFKAGIEALQPPERPASEGVVTVALSDTDTGLLVTSGGGVVALRHLESAAGPEGTGAPDPETVLREIRITLGQLPGGIRAGIKQVKVFGPPATVRSLAGQLQPRLAPLGISVQEVSHYLPGDFVTPSLPANTPVSPALSLAAQYLSGRSVGLDFLPPRIKPWQEFSARYSSKKLAWAGGIAAAAALLTASLFIMQQWQISHLRSQWAALATQTAELENLQQQIRRFRPWFDESRGSLSILRRLTEAFPEDGTVTAKTLEIRDVANVTCSGVARDNAALLKTLDRLRATREVGEVKVDQIRGKAPLQFSFNFHWGERTSNEH